MAWHSWGVAGAWAGAWLGGALASGGAPTCPVLGPCHTRSESSGAQCGSQGSWPMAGCSVRTGGLPFLGWSEGPSGKEAKAQRTGLLDPLRLLQPGSLFWCRLGPSLWWRVETLALVGVWTCPALEMPSAQSLREGLGADLGGTPTCPARQEAPPLGLACQGFSPPSQTRPHSGKGRARSQGPPRPGPRSQVPTRISSWEAWGGDATQTLAQCGSGAGLIPKGTSPSLLGSESL